MQELSPSHQIALQRRVEQYAFVVSRGDLGTLFAACTMRGPEGVGEVFPPNILSNILPNLLSVAFIISKFLFMNYTPAPFQAFLQTRSKHPFKVSLQTLFFSKPPSKLPSLIQDPSLLAKLIGLGPGRFLARSKRLWLGLVPARSKDGRPDCCRLAVSKTVFFKFEVNSHTLINHLT